MFLDQDHILVIETISDAPYLFVYYIKNVQQPVARRQLQLPDAWRNWLINFHRNDAPMADPPRSSNALFYSDPTRRILMLSARPSAQAKAINWMMFPERLFTWPWIRGQNVSWNDWSQYVIVRNTSTTRIIGKPAVTGSRVLYLDHDSSGMKVRINSIAFLPHSESAETSQTMWDFVGKHTPLVPTEARREIPAINGMGSKLQDLRVTEDNIVLLYVSVALPGCWRVAHYTQTQESNSGQMPIKILTFGAPNGSSSPR